MTLSTRFGYKGASHLEELSARLRSTVMLRRTKAEVPPSLPSKFRSVIEPSPETNLSELLRAQWRAFECWMERTTGAPGNGNGDGYQKRVKGLARFQGPQWSNLAVARHETARAKVPLVSAFIRELFENGSGKVTLFAHHKDIIAQLAEELACFGPVTLTGETAPKTRTQVVDRFHSDPACRLFIGNIVAAGTGITLAPASSHCVFAEVSWVPAEMTQAEDRLHRVGTVTN